MNIRPEHQKRIAALAPDAKSQQAFVDQAIENALQTAEKAHQNEADALELYVDGGSRGNPGPAGGGYAVFRNGQLVMKGSEFFGRKTNNQAEYMALKTALQAVLQHFPQSPVHCFMDSQLVVRQLQGHYKVKSANVAPLFRDVQTLLKKLPHFVIQHVPRSQNKLADQLANEAMDAGR